MTAPGEPLGPRGRVAGANPGLAALAEGLDRLREALHARLGELEALAAEQQRSGQPVGSPSDRERALREKVAALEAGQARLQAEFRRRETEWEEDLAQVASDRKLLTEAWERLEKERAEGAPAEPQRGLGPAAARPATPAAAAPVQGVSGDSVTTAILREFQLLKGEVRRNAKSANGR